MEKIGKFLKNIRPEKIELLTYHAMGEAKYRAVNNSEPIKFDKVGDSTIDKLYDCGIKYLS